MLQKIKDNSGSVMLIEAALVFPIVFFVLLFLIYFGNIFYIQAKVDNLVTSYAISAAAKCVDPVLSDIENSGSVPLQIDKVEPYYAFGGMNTIESKVEKGVKDSFEIASLFKNMSPKFENCTAKYQNYVMYATFKVETKYTIQFPIKFWGENTFWKYDCSSRAEIVVDDTSEFIRNTNMAVDYMQQWKVTNDFLGKLEEGMGKFKEFLGVN